MLLCCLPPWRCEGVLVVGVGKPLQELWWDVQGAKKQLKHHAKKPQNRRLVTQGKMLIISFTG
jgi:hypothetical protein